jgi:hypothetical protein
MVRPEPATKRLDGVVYRDLDHRAVKEAGRAGIRWDAGDCLYSDRTVAMYPNTHNLPYWLKIAHAILSESAKFS